MKKKKNRILLAIFSLFPGTGHMYLGFMKMGVSLVFLFCASLMLCDITGADWLAVFPLTIYLYSLFHANNLGGLDDAAFQETEDKYLFGLEGIEGIQKAESEKSKKILAGVLIFIGVSVFWNMGLSILKSFFRGYEGEFFKQWYFILKVGVPRSILGIAFIWLGIVLIRNKKVTVEMENIREAETGEEDAGKEKIEAEKGGEE